MVVQGIANKGVVMRPHVMAEFRNATGGLVQRYQRPVFKDAESAKAAESVSKLMQLVTKTPAGAAYDVGSPPQRDIAVKTGTAQAGAGNRNATDWMIGLAPAYDPLVAVVVVVPLKARPASGAAIAGPIMKAMTTLALRLLLLQESGVPTAFPSVPASPPPTSPPAQPGRPLAANRHMPRRPAVRERRSMRPRLGAECSP
jgi:cell division protein FtsI/penicillin-binding protein 2